MIKLVKKNILSLSTALVIMYLSFAGADTFSDVDILDLPYLDKIVHMCMYFGLMIVMLYENRPEIKNYRSHFFLALFPLTYGTLIEILQPQLTSTRMGDFFDVVFNILGIILALTAWRLFHILRKKEK
jgi:VanZ family protein